MGKGEGGGRRWLSIEKEEANVELNRVALAIGSVIRSPEGDKRGAEEGGARSI